LMLAPTFSAIAAALPGLIAAFAPLLGPMGIIMGIAAGVALLYKAWTENWGGIQEKTKAVIDFLKGIPDKVIRLFKGIIDWFKNNWILFFGPAGLVYKAWTENWGGIQDKVGGIVEAIKKPFLNIGEKFRKFGNEAFGKAKGFLKGITGWQTQIENEVAKYGKAIIDYLKSLPGKVFKAGQEIIMKWVDGIKGAVDKVKKAGGWIAGKLADFIGHSLPKEGPLAHPERGGKSIIEAWLEGIEDKGGEVEQVGKDMADALRDGLDSNWGKWMKNFKDRFMDFLDDFESSVKSEWSGIIAGWIEGTKTWETFWTEMWESLRKTAVNKLSELVADAVWDFLEKKIINIGTMLIDVIGSFGKNLIKIPMMIKDIVVGLGTVIPAVAAIAWAVENIAIPGFETFVDIVGDVAGAIGSLGETVADVFADIMDWLFGANSLFKKFVDWIGSAIDSIFDWLFGANSLWKKFWDWITGANAKMKVATANIQSFASQINRIPRRIYFDIFGRLHIPKLPKLTIPVRFAMGELNLPKFQTGIPYVPETMPAILHKGERVIPASQNNPARLGFGDIHIPVRMNIQNVNTRADEEELVDVVRGAIRKEIDERLRRP